MKCKNMNGKIQNNKQKANNKFRINNIKKQELKEQGVTMLSLVVTIVILLILSGITIKFALNDNGVIKQSKLASEKYKNSTIQEQAALNEVAKQMSTVSSSSGTSGESGESGSSENTNELKQQIETLQDQVDKLNNQIDDLKTKQATGNATPDQVLSGATFSTSEEIGLAGTMVNHSAITNAVSIGSDGNKIYLRTTKGAYLTNSSTGYPEISAAISDINNITGYKFTQAQYDSNGSNNYNSGYSNGYATGKNSVESKVLSGSKTNLSTSGTFSGYSLYVATAITYNRDQYSAASMQASLVCSVSNANYSLIADTGSSQSDKSAWCRTWIIIPKNASDTVSISVSGKKAQLSGIN